jgi:uncharacterized metal-binding protein
MDGKSHAAASVALAVPSALAVTALLQDPIAGALAAAGCVLGIPVSPDLDQDGVTLAEGVVYGHLGAIPGILWRSYWMPYALAIPHRHWTSHAPVVGTLLRILYLLIVPLIVDLRGTVAVALKLWPLWLGLAISDMAHWAMDYLV